MLVGEAGGTGDSRGERALGAAAVHLAYVDGGGKDGGGSLRTRVRTAKSRVRKPRVAHVHESPSVRIRRPLARSVVFRQRAMEASSVKESKQNC